MSERLDKNVISVGRALLRKAKGEGARGGHVIGHTRSGIPIYESQRESARGGHILAHTSKGHEIIAERWALHPLYAHFTSRDHQDAAQAHAQTAVSLGWEASNQADRRDGEDFLNHATRHAQVSNEHQDQYLRLEQEEHRLRTAGLVKAEGSRGGHVIGHTGSGKPIYQASKHSSVHLGVVHGGHEEHTPKRIAEDQKNAAALKESHPDYSAQDHKDAAAAHYARSKRLFDSSYHAGQDGQGRNTMAYRANQVAQAHLDAGQDLARANKNMINGYGLDYLRKSAHGEGSRGGKIIGHTKSGKPVYAATEHSHVYVQKFRAEEGGPGGRPQADGKGTGGVSLGRKESNLIERKAVADHPHYTAEDHGDAAALHERAGKMVEGRFGRAQSMKHHNAKVAHWLGRNRVNEQATKAKS